MTENSKIEWTHHTFNPWVGCTKVSPACKNCYAEKRVTDLKFAEWGEAAERRVTSDNNWRKPLAWDRQARNVSERHRVFCASWADVFEDRRDLDDHRRRLWQLIAETPNLDWLLLTKRIEHVADLTPWDDALPENVWIGTTVENQEWADRRLPYLLDLNAAVRFVSVEPMLGPIDLSPWLKADTAIDWVIAGGESGRKARAGNPDWFRSLRDQCTASGTPFLFKQWGEFGDVDEGAGLVRLGKKKSGRNLDNRTWDEFPRLHPDSPAASLASSPLIESPPPKSDWFVPAASVEAPPDDERWLVEHLVGIEAVGIIGGEPKLGKSWLASHLAVAVASGENCLEQLTVYDSGPVLMVSAEGPPWMSTDRLQGICGHLGLDLAELPIHVMSKLVPRLDDPRDQNRLGEEVARHNAKLVILDPLMQLHQGDENSSAGVAPVLNFLSQLRRQTGASVMLVHHVSKGARGRGGSRLRGSSALHGWLDSGLYLAGQGNDAELTTEQRSGPPIDPMVLRLVTDTEHHHLEIVDPEEIELPTASGTGELKAQVVAILGDLGGPVPRSKIRQLLSVKNERLTEPLRELVTDGTVVRTSRGLMLKAA